MSRAGSWLLAHVAALLALTGFVAACGAFDSADVVVRDAGRGLESACAFYREAPGVKHTREADAVCSYRAAACNDGSAGAGGAP